MASKVQDSAEAWGALDAILFAANKDTTRKYVETLVPKEVRKTLESTGDKPRSKMVTRSEELVRAVITAGKHAIQISAEPGKVFLQYFAKWQVWGKERLRLLISHGMCMKWVGRAARQGLVESHT